MKELSIEQKAKAYDIALDKIKMLLGTGSSCSREELEYIFPELKESDEIWKDIIHHIEFGKNHNIIPCKRAESWIAWLEKYKGCETEINLAYKNHDEVVYNRGYNDGYKCGFQADVTEEDIQKAASNYIDEEQSIFFEGVAYGQKHQKPVEWSEDDQSNFCELSSFIFETYRAEDASRLITWLKSLKNRYTWKPSEEQMELIKDIVFKDRQKITRKELAIFHSIYNDLKKLKD